MNNPRIHVVIINTTQFGYHIDSYMYCKYLDKKKFRVSYVCFDMGFPMNSIMDVEIVYVRLHKNKFLRFLKFALQLRSFLKKNPGSFNFHVYNKFNLLTRFLNFSKPMVLDIRTGSLHPGKLIRLLQNSKIRLTACFYGRISIVAQSLAKELGFSTVKTHIIPLGGEVHHSPKKTYGSLKILYIGTLVSRNIHDTIIGISLFMKKYPEVKTSYDIVGDGSKEWTDRIYEAIRKTGLQETVILHGRKKHHELKEYLLAANLGLVYVPVSDWYQFQPSTKMYEYTLAGLPVIATETYENRITLKKDCGILCKSDPESVAYALESFWEKRDNWDSDFIRNAYLESTWQNIVESCFSNLFRLNQ